MVMLMRIEYEISKYTAVYPRGFIDKAQESF